MKDDRIKRLKLNTITSLVLQFVTVICGFILPRLILESFGSEINGLVNSITQFLGVITLLDFGVGAVVQSALYKPLAENDTDMISKIYVSANKFFRRLAEILLVYVVLLMTFYPMLVNKSFGHMYTALLIAAICISSFAQYYFGIVNSLLLNADQRGYIQYTAQIITLILNTIACYVVIKFGASIQIVKLTTSLIFLLRPFFLVFYVKKHYAINRKIKYTEEPIKQKWNGMAQHFASYVLGGTDNIVLTLFSTLENVSIYSVYYLVVSGIMSLINSFTRGFQSLVGNLLANGEKKKLYNVFQNYHWLIHTLSTIFYGCAMILIVDFVSVYTSGINDINYKQPIFAILIVIAYYFYSLRDPYIILILAAGHYKQTQSNYIVAMILNIVISIATVKIWGLVGVSIGTLVAMAYQTVWMARYDSKNIICWPFKNFLKQCGVDTITVIVASLATFKIPMLSVSYVSWFLLAIEVFAVWLVIAVLINIVFYRERVLSMFRRVKGRFVK